MILAIALGVASCGAGKATPDGGRGGSGDTGTGGAGGASACATASPCGGDIVGAWRVMQSCFSEDLGSVCPGASATIAFASGGTMTFGADQTYAANTAGGATTHYHYPGACIPNGYTCAQYGQLLTSVGLYSSVNCISDAAGFCNCDAITASTSPTETGTYRTSGVTLQTTHSGSTSSAPYCVQGNLLYLLQAPGDGGVQVTGSIVLERQ